MENREHLRKHSLPLVFCLSLDKPNLCELFVSRVVNYTAVTLTGVIFFDLGESHDQCSVNRFSKLKLHLKKHYIMSISSAKIHSYDNW